MKKLLSRFLDRVAPQTSSPFERLDVLEQKLNLVIDMFEDVQSDVRSIKWDVDDLFRTPGGSEEVDLSKVEDELTKIRWSLEDLQKVRALP